MVDIARQARWTISCQVARTIFKVMGVAGRLSGRAALQGRVGVEMAKPWLIIINLHQSAENELTGSRQEVLSAHDAVAQDSPELPRTPSLDERCHAFYPSPVLTDGLR